MWKGTVCSRASQPKERSYLNPGVPGGDAPGPFSRLWEGKQTVGGVEGGSL